MTHNGNAAYYAYLALKDHEKADILRRFKYYASADYVERRAKRYDALCRKALGAAPMTDAAPVPSSHGPKTNDLHTTSDGDDDPGLFGFQEPQE